MKRYRRYNPRKTALRHLRRTTKTITLTWIYPKCFDRDHWDAHQRASMYKEFIQGWYIAWRYYE